MSVLWRISNRADLEGIGGEKSDGRWHTAARGKRIVYLAEHPAVALVEVLANLHTSPGLLPDTYQLMKVLTPAQLPLQVLSPDLLTALWRDHPRETQSIGDDWLAKCSSALLVVPSAPAPESQNCLLNPLHPDSRLLTMEWCRRMKYDRRLFRISEPPVRVLHNRNRKINQHQILPRCARAPDHQVLGLQVAIADALRMNLRQFTRTNSGR